VALSSASARPSSTRKTCPRCDHNDRFQVHIGRCRRCGRRVQARHPGQTSEALGAAAAQVGPRALAVHLNKTVGASMGKTAAMLRQVSASKVTTGGLRQMLARTPKQARPTYEALVDAVRESPVVAADETG
jgi:transposase